MACGLNISCGRTWINKKKTNLSECSGLCVKSSSFFCSTIQLERFIISVTEQIKLYKEFGHKVKYFHYTN